jgi:hypothetical protein
MVEMKQMSVKDWLERKKYMGVWRWELDQTSKMMNRLPNTVTRYMDRNSPKSTDSSSGSSENPIRWNLWTGVKFCVSIFLGHL